MTKGIANVILRKIYRFLLLILLVHTYILRKCSYHHNNLKFIVFTELVKIVCHLYNNNFKYWLGVLHGEKIEKNVGELKIE